MHVSIESIRYITPSGEFEATIVERDDDGSEVGKIIAAAKSLSRLCEIIAPASPDNL